MGCLTADLAVAEWGSSSGRGLLTCQLDVTFADPGAAAWARARSRTRYASSR